VIGEIEKRFPVEFDNLLDLVDDWALPSQQARNDKRVSSTMHELQAFYDRMLPQIKEISAYLDRYSLDVMPPPAVTLLFLGMMLMEIAPAVEIMKTPDVISDYPRARLIIHPQKDQFKMAAV
jgi:hypothetical protein